MAGIVTLFKEGQTVKLLDTGERVKVVEVRVSGFHVFYRVEQASGETLLLMATKLREIFG